MPLDVRKIQNDKGVHFLQEENVLLPCDVNAVWLIHHLLNLWFLNREIQNFRPFSQRQHDFLFAHLRKYALLFHRQCDS